MRRQPLRRSENSNTLRPRARQARSRARAVNQPCRPSSVQHRIETGRQRPRCSASRSASPPPTHQGSPTPPSPCIYVAIASSSGSTSHNLTPHNPRSMDEPPSKASSTTSPFDSRKHRLPLNTYRSQSRSASQDRRPPTNGPRTTAGSRDVRPGKAAVRQLWRGCGMAPSKRRARLFGTVSAQRRRRRGVTPARFAERL